MGAHGEVLGLAAVRVLADRGGRGFTHRAVDEYAGVPTGTASRYARSRVALFAMAADALFDADVRDTAAAAVGAPGASIDAVVDVLLSATASLAAQPQRYLARVELQLEARRMPELRQRFDDARRTFVDAVAAMLDAAGVSRSTIRADTAVGVIDGLLHRQLVLEQPPLPDAQVRALLDALVAQP